MKALKKLKTLKPMIKIEFVYQRDKIQNLEENMMRQIINIQANMYLYNKILELSIEKTNN